MLNDKDAWRLQYHLMPPDGWLNDPNGLCQMHGIYHIYFQYSPNTPAPDGRKARTWGHYAGPDLLHLDFKGVPFWPEEDDHDGCYSGCALIDHDAIQLYYTGNIKRPGDYDYIHDGRESNTILIETKDGVTYGPKRVLMRTPDYPAECTRHVRDPKVWKQDGLYHMVLGARMQDERGAVLVYTSRDGLQWTLQKVLSTPKPFGYMWECPDYFELDGKRILSCCPQGVSSEEYRYQNIYQAGYFMMNGDAPEDFREWDYGFDFYAPQSFVDEAGRRLFIGWIGMPDHPYDNPTDALGWENALTVPRELTWEDGCVRQKPVSELAQLRGSALEMDEEGAVCFADGAGDVEADLTGVQGGWSIQIGEGVTLRYEGGVISLQMSWRAGRGRTCRRIRIGQVTDMRMLIDTSVLEIYFNGGQYVMTSRFYPDYESPARRRLTVRFHCPGAKICSWQMNTMQTNIDLQ